MTSLRSSTNAKLVFAVILFPGTGLTGFHIFNLSHGYGKVKTRDQGLFSKKKKKGHACDFSEKGQKNKIFENFDKMIQNLKMV